MDAPLNSPYEPAARDLAEMAMRVADNVPAMLAYWDAHQICQFANEAYRAWFGKSRAEIVGRSMQELLGLSLYELNLPYILGALAGQTQVFERTVPNPVGTGRESLATYTPDISDGVVHGFFVHVADVTAMKTIERQLEAALRDVRTLSGLLPICMHCKKIRDSEGVWTDLERYIRDRTRAEFSHGICPVCNTRHYPDVDRSL
jgi:PAS domain S-box-containing protein